MEPHDQDHDRGSEPFRPGSGGFGSDGGSFGGGGFGDGPAGPGPDGLRLCPWECREKYGLLNALYLTTREILTAPGTFFHRMPTRVGLAQPLLYAIVLGVIAALGSWVWSLAGSSLKTLAPGDVFEGLLGPMPSFFAFVASPLIVALDITIRAGLFHLMLMLLGGNKLGFEATFRVAAYSKAAGVVALLPFCGSLIAALWELAINVIGLYRIHGTDPWRAMIAVLGPAMICLFSVAALVMLAFMGAGIR